MIMARLAIAIAALAVAVVAMMLANIALAAAPGTVQNAAPAATPKGATQKNAAPQTAELQKIPAVTLPAPGTAATPVVPPHLQSTAPTINLAIITQDQTSLRAAPRHTAQQQATLWQGEVVEVRGERLDYLQVYDHKRERGGFVHVSTVRRTNLAATEAPELLAVVRFIREAPGTEALGIGLTAAYLKAAPADALNGAAGVEAFDALGTFADRLARRASSGSLQDKAAAAVLTAHLEVAARYGLGFANFEQEGRMRICYDGEAFRRVLALPSTPEQRARAALALTRHECVDPEMRAADRVRLDDWRAEVLDRADTLGLTGYLKNRLQMRRAGVWAGVAYQRARQGKGAEEAANRALAELAAVNKAELPEADAAAYNDAAMRVSASRWAAVPATQESGVVGNRPVLVTVAGLPGETCVLLIDAKNDAQRPLIKRCTYGIVWTASATLNREGNALAVAVQPMHAWREIWVFRKTAQGWTVGVLPPASTSPELGYAEFAGWVPGGAQMLVAREARGEGKYQRSFELIALDTLGTERQVAAPSMLSTFQRWQDPSWKRMSLSLR
jgi:hypothetical protein